MGEPFLRRGISLPAYFSTLTGPHARRPQIWPAVLTKTRLLSTIARPVPISRRRSPLLREPLSGSSAIVYESPNPDSRRRVSSYASPLSTTYIISNPLPENILEHIKPIPLPALQALGSWRDGSFCVLFLSRAFASQLDPRSSFLPTILGKLLQNVPLQDASHGTGDIRVVVAIVDTISSPGGSDQCFGIGHDGMAVLVADSVFYDFEALDSQTLAAGSEWGAEASDIPYLSVHVRDPSHASEAPHCLKFGLANTLFENGKRVSLFEDTWQRQQNGLILNRRRELKSLALHLTKGGKGPSPTVSAPLVPLTVPRRIKSSYGNILAELVADETTPSISIPSSKELTSSVMRFVELNPTSILSGGKPEVYALIIPEEALPTEKESGPLKSRHGILYSGSAPPTDGAFLEHLWLNPSDITSGKVQLDLGRMISKGSAIRKVLGGGGEWGHRASLVALEHEDEFEASCVASSPIIDETSDGDASQISPKLSKTLAPAGSFVQYYCVVHPPEQSSSGSSTQQENPTNLAISFSHIPVDAFERQSFGKHAHDRSGGIGRGEATFNVPTYGRFGISTSSQLALQSKLRRSGSSVETPLNVPYATVRFMSLRPARSDRHRRRKASQHPNLSQIIRSLNPSQLGPKMELLRYDSALVIRKHQASVGNTRISLHQPVETSARLSTEGKGRNIPPFRKYLVRKHLASRPSEKIDALKIRSPRRRSVGLQVNSHVVSEKPPPLIRRVLEMPGRIISKHHLPVTLQVHHFDNPMYEPVVKDHMIRSHYHRRLIRKHAATEERKSEYGTVGNPALQGVVRVRRRIHKKLIHLMMRVSAIRGIKGNIHEYEVPRRGKRHMLKVKGAIKHRYTDNVVWLKNPLQILRMIKDQRDLEAQRNRAEGREDTLVVRTLREIADPNRHRIEVRDKARGKTQEAPKAMMSDIDPRYLTTRELMRELYQELKRLKKEVIHYRK